jgi:DNA end-binding protein Ku
MLELATHIIDKMTGRFEPEKFEDRYENALIELIRSKQKGMPVKAQPVQRQTNVINLMDALRRSVEGAGAPSGAKGGTERASDKKAEKGAPAKKTEKTEKAAPKARTSAAKARTRRAG